MSSPALALHLRGNNNTITAIDFGQDNEKFAVSSLDKTVALYSVNRSHKRVLKFKYDFEIYEVGYSCKNMFAVVGGSKKIAIAEAILHKGHQETIIGHQSNIRTVHFAKSGNRIITGSDDKSVKMFRLGQRNFISSFNGHTNWIRCVRFSPANDMIASCAEDKTLKIFDAHNNTLIHSFKDEKGFGNQLCWRNDNNTIAIAQENGRVKVFDVAQRKLVQYYRIYDCPVKCLDFHPSGDYMVTGDARGLTKILDLQEGRDIFTITGHQGSVTAAKFNPDGNYFVTGSADKHIMVFKWRPDDDENKCENVSTELRETPAEDNETKTTMIDTRKSLHYNYLDEGISV